MYRLLLYVVLCCFVTSAYAQIFAKPAYHYSLEWNKGSVVFLSGDTVLCKVRYNQSIPGGALQITDDQNIITLSAKDVSAFSFYDKKKNRTRKFSTLPVLDGEPEFLECIYNDGHFSLLNHKTIAVPHEYMNYSRFIARPAILNKKYILDPKTGDLLPLTKENTLKVLENDKDEITAYIREHRIKFKNVADYIHVFRYCSSL